MANILIIDDCQPLVSAFERVLRNAGHDVRGTASSQHGVELLRQGSVALVILDIYMPVPDGLQILQFAKQAKLTVPFLVISGCDLPTDMLATFRWLGVVFTLEKPVTAEHLLETVEAALDRTYGSLRTARSQAVPAPDAHDKEFTSY